MAPTASAAGIRSVVLLAGLLALSAPSTDAQNTTVNSTNNSDSNDRPVCPVQGENYCVCAAGSCSSCVECAGCKDWQCIAPPARWTGPQSSRAAVAGSGRRLREIFSRSAPAPGLLKPAAAAAARAASRSLLQAGPSNLVCDGRVHQLNMPAAPLTGYPTAVPWNPPFTNQAGFSCARRLANPEFCAAPNSDLGNDTITSGLCCGSAASTTCGEFSFSPVTSASGGSRGIVNPRNPITYQVTAANTFLTYVEFTAIDVGTAGARLAGGYNRDVIRAVEAIHSWTQNGPFQAVAGNGTIIETYGPCSNCKDGEGVKTLNVTALPGTGFTRIELSQAFDNTGCSDAGATNVNADGMLWSGMRYSCILPSCKDADLQAQGNQPYDCAAAPGPLSWVYNPAAVDNTTVTPQSCCLPITCEDTLPLTPTKDAYNCTSNVGPGYKTKPGSQALAANNANCCEFVPTCGLPAPGSGPFNSCSQGFVYDSDKANSTDLGACCKYVPTCAKPSATSNATYQCTPPLVYASSSGSSTSPSDATCCTGTCGDTRPDVNGTQPIICGPGFVRVNGSDTFTPANQSRCCVALLATCIDANTTQDGNQSYTCPSFAVLNPSPLPGFPSDANCCLNKTCGNTNPAASQAVPQTCAPGFVLDSNKTSVTPPSPEACCRYVPTCAKPSATSNATYQCTPPLVYASSSGSSTSPSDATCCTGTCGDTRPDVNGTQPIDCGPGFDRVLGSDTFTPADIARCCVAEAPVVPTCKDANTTEFGDQPYTCPSYAVRNPSPLPGFPSEANCCLNRTCNNTDPTSPTPVPQACPASYILNVNMSDVSPPNASICCMPRISCIDVNPDKEGCQPFICNPTLGYIVNQNATYLPNPSNEVCCLRRTCADRDPLAPRRQRFGCGAAFEYDPTQDNNGPPTRSLCCNPLATCGDTDVVKRNKQPFNCAAAEGWVSKPGSDGTTSPSNTTCCLRRTCADTDPTTAALDPQACPAGSFPDSSKSSFSPPSAEQCCKFEPSCNDTLPDVPGCQPYKCDASRGLAFKVNATDLDPSDAKCCLVQTCLDTDPNTPGDQTFNCGPNQQYDWRRNTTVAPTRGKCCQPLPTCADTDPFAGKAQTYFCDPERGLQYNFNAGTLKNPSDSVCCLTLARATCADTDPNNPGNLTYQCPEGSVPNLANAGSTTVTAASCCSPTCSNFNLATPGPSAFACPAGSAPNQANVRSTTVTAASCCSPTCANSNLASPGASFTCPAGSVANMANNGSTTVTAASCCSPTCANTNLASPAAALTCPAGSVPNMANTNSTTVTAASCCSPTCANTNLASPGSAFTCPAGSVPNMANTGSTTVTAASCCSPTCANTNPASPTPTPFTCPSGALTTSANANSTTVTAASCCSPTCANWNLAAPGPSQYPCKPGNSIALGSSTKPPSESNCCIGQIPIPSPLPPSPAPGPPTCAGWVCPAGTLPNPGGRTKRACHQDCCLPTCTDTDVDTSGNQTYTCPSTWIPKPGSEMASPDNTYACCIQGSPTPAVSPQPGPTPTPSCTPRQCPAPATINALLPQGFSISSSSGSTVTVTFKNNAFLKCDCTQGLSWLTIATCSSPSSSAVNCQKITNVRLGDEVTLNKVACGAVIDVIIHDGQCKNLWATSNSPASQSPKRVSLSGCRAGTTLPNGCRSGDGDGACGGSYSYRVVCSGGRHLLRKLHFF